MEGAAARFNVARHLRATAERDPEGAAILAAQGREWERVSFRGLDQRSDAVARALFRAGLARGERTLVMVRAGVPLISLTYACFKAGIVPVLIDPGMGLRAFLRCVADTRPTAFVGIPLAHAVRLAFPSPFRTVRRLVTVGRRFGWGGASLGALTARETAVDPLEIADTEPGDEAAILFTSGSTGPAKGAVYSHANFDAQVRLLREMFGFAPGEVDLAAFPLFSLFDAAFGMTSVIPDLDPSRPGRCDPAKVAAALVEHRATNAFGSPAIWRRVAPWCLSHGLKLPHLRRVLMAGASVSPALIEKVHELLGPEGDVFTPYGATEALPVACIAGREVLRETAKLSATGAGTCVGRPVGDVLVRIIHIADEPIPEWTDGLVVPSGQVGEICAKGPVVTRAYHNRPEATTSAKIADGAECWHRMGDLGYVAEDGRVWFCGRKAERVETAAGPLFTDRVEGMALTDSRVQRCALVGIGGRGAERPVLIVEGREQVGLADDLLRRVPVERVLFHPRFPVDVRHNAKINRGALKAWAEGRLSP
jgi:olefin beta-lactone synthetase